MLSLAVSLLLVVHYAAVTFAITTERFKNVLRDEHNEMRSNVAEGTQLGYDSTYFPKGIDLIRLDWDNALAGVAQIEANTCIYNHSKKANRETYMSQQTQDNIAYPTGSWIGENIAMMQGTNVVMDEPTLRTLINGWLENEAAQTVFSSSTNNIATCHNNCGSTPQTLCCKHFSQGIWSDTQYIGCAYKNCAGTPNPWTYLVCNYYPGGNVGSDEIYTSATPSTTCTSGSACTTPTTSALTCYNDHLCAPDAPTLQPTQAPTVTCPNACVRLTNFGTANLFTAMNGQWDCTGRVNSKPKFAHINNQYTLTWTGDFYVIQTDGDSGWHGYCTENSITDCTQNKWKYSDSAWVTDTDATISQPATCTSPPTSSPVVPSPIPSTLTISNYCCFLNGVYSKTTDVAGYPAYENAHPVYIQYNAAWDGYIMTTTSGSNSAYASCSGNDINNCDTGADWGGSFSVVAAAQTNDKVKLEIPLQAEDTSPNNVATYPLNMTEIHIILILLVIVLVTMCGIIFGFCYVKRRKTREQSVKVSENEMVYFENRTVNEHNSPTVEFENLNKNIQTQPTLKINVNGAATMVTKLPTTTPVTPLITMDQNYE